jgi:hypothetical protein
VHNSHSWSEMNPRETTEGNFQHRFSTNMWCAIISSHLIGPYIFEGRLMREVCLTCLQNELSVHFFDYKAAYLSVTLCSTSRKLH